jgi:hypothetical protein
VFIAVGKYDDLIGGGKIIIDVDEILDEQLDMINDRRSLVEKLILLIEEDIELEADNIVYLNNFLNTLKDYLKRL